MENTLRLYSTMITILSQHKNWLDKRHLKTLAWMMVGLIQSGTISLTAWVPYVVSRAEYAQSTLRRFSRWLSNERIEVHSLYGPLIQQSLSEWREHRLYLVLDTSMLWGRYCLIRIGVVYRGRAIPLVWTVLEHASSSVSFHTYQKLLHQASLLLPRDTQVVFLADRGFADTALMGALKGLGWHWRIRIKKSFWVYRLGGPGRCKVEDIGLFGGEARFWHYVYLTEEQFGPVHLALGRSRDTRECWYVVSDEPTDLTTFDEYGLRTGVEESFLDDKSNGFQLESSLIRDAAELSRLCFVLAITTLYLVCQGTEVVSQGKRRSVDSHWFRGSSYLKIGWQWIKSALVNGWQLVRRLRLDGQPDPEPSQASRQQVPRCPSQRLTGKGVTQT